MSNIFGNSKSVGSGGSTTGLDTSTLNTIKITSNDLVISDNCIILGSDNPADTLTSSLSFEYNNAGKKWGGIGRDKSTHKMYMYKDVTAEINGNTNLAVLNKADIECGLVNGIDVNTIAPTDTDDVSEGTVNKYYTDGRVDTRLTTLGVKAFNQDLNTTNNVTFDTVITDLLRFNGNLQIQSDGGAITPHMVFNQSLGTIDVDCWGIKSTNDIPYINLLNYSGNTELKVNNNETIVASVNSGSNVITVSGTNTTMTKPINITDTTQATDTATGTITTAGGMGVSKSVHVGENITSAGVITNVIQQKTGADLAVKNAINNNIMVFTQTGNIDIDCWAVKSSNNIPYINLENYSGNTQLIIHNNESISASVNNSNILTMNETNTTLTKPINITDTTVSTDFNTGALIVDGGAGIQGDVNIGGNVSATNTNAHIADATIHRSINDSSTSTTSLWSSDKINTQINAQAIAPTSSIQVENIATENIENITFYGDSMLHEPATTYNMPNYSITSSTEAAGFQAYKAFDNNASTRFYTLSGGTDNYNGVSGLYNGTNSTNLVGGGNIAGAWIQIAFTKKRTLYAHQYLAFSINIDRASFLYSNDGGTLFTVFDSFTSFDTSVRTITPLTSKIFRMVIQKQVTAGLQASLQDWKLNGRANNMGRSTIFDNTASSTTSNGALVVYGGMGVAGSVNCGPLTGTTVACTNGQNATSYATGACRVTGGLSVSNTAYIHNASIQSTLGVLGMATVNQLTLSTGYISASGVIQDTARSCYARVYAILTFPSVGFYNVNVPAHPSGADVSQGYLSSAISFNLNTNPNGLQIVDIGVYEIFYTVSYLITSTTDYVRFSIYKAGVIEYSSVAIAYNSNAQVANITGNCIVSCTTSEAIEIYASSHSGATNVSIYGLSLTAKRLMRNV